MLLARTCSAPVTPRGAIRAAETGLAPEPVVLCTHDRSLVRRQHAGAACVRLTRGLTVGLCTTIAAVAFEAIAVATAMPVAAEQLGGLRNYAWSFSLFLIAMLFTTVVAGRLSDGHGPSRLLACGLLVFVIGLLVAGTATGMSS